MSTDNTEKPRGVMERRSFLQYASGAVMAGAAVLRPESLLAQSQANGPAAGRNQSRRYSGGAAAAASAHKYDKMYVATVTPYQPGTEDVDYAAYRSFIRYWAQPKFVNANGGILVTPEAGEVFYLTTQEKVRLAEIALAEAGDKTMVFCGVMQPTTKACVEEAKAIKKTGVHGLFLIPPIGTIDVVSSWNPDRHPEVWTDMLNAIADATELPVIVHPTGGQTFGMPIKPMLKILDAVPSIIGWKMITQDDPLETAKALRAFPKRHVGILWAGAPAFYDGIANGYFDGTVSGFWNYSMEKMVDAVVAQRDEKNDEKAKQIWSSGLNELHGSIMGGKYGFRLHSAYKAATWLRGLIPDPFMRAPQRKLPLNEVREIRDLMVKAGLGVISERDVQRAYPNT